MTMMIAYQELSVMMDDAEVSKSNDLPCVMLLQQHFFNRGSIILILNPRVKSFSANKISMFWKTNMWNITTRGVVGTRSLEHLTWHVRPATQIPSARCFMIIVAKEKSSGFVGYGRRSKTILILPFSIPIKVSNLSINWIFNVTLHTILFINVYNYNLIYVSSEI